MVKNQLRKLAALTGVPALPASLEAWAGAQFRLQEVCQPGKLIVAAASRKEIAR